MIGLVVLARYQPVTDRQTDGQMELLQQKRVRSAQLCCVDTR